jgi:Rieske Fe-S protein
VGFSSDLNALPVLPGSALHAEGDELTYPLPGSDGATIDRDNEVILVRFKGVIYAFALSCPHQNTTLRWLASDGRFQCPKHKSKYQPDGVFLSGKATRNMDRHPVRRSGKLVAVNLAVLYRSDKNPTEWAQARLAVA